MGHSFPEYIVFYYFTDMKLKPRVWVDFKISELVTVIWELKLMATVVFYLLIILVSEDSQ